MEISQWNLSLQSDRLNSDYFMKEWWNEYHQRNYTKKIDTRDGSLYTYVYIVYHSWHFMWSLINILLKETEPMYFPQREAQKATKKAHIPRIFNTPPTSFNFTYVCHVIRKKQSLSKHWWLRRVPIYIENYKPQINKPEAPMAVLREPSLSLATF